MPPPPDEIVRDIRRRAAGESILVTQHGQQEMVEEAIVLDDVLEALRGCRLLEDYPVHLRGACCLVLGYTQAGRPLHIVCTTSLATLVIITVYEPRLPKWSSPTERGRK